MNKYWQEWMLRKTILDAGFTAHEVSDSEYMLVLNRWGFTMLSAQRELASARERRAEYGAGAAGGAGAVHSAERFVDGRCNGCGVPKQARW